MKTNLDEVFSDDDRTGCLKVKQWHYQTLEGVSRVLEQGLSTYCPTGSLICVQLNSSAALPEKSPVLRFLLPELKKKKGGCIMLTSIACVACQASLPFVRHFLFIVAHTHMYTHTHTHRDQETCLPVAGNWQ